MPASKKGSSKDVIEELRNNGCTIYYEKSLTKNLGNYESAKVTVGVTLPIEPTKEEKASIQTTIETADEIVTKELEVQLKELLDAK